MPWPNPKCARGTEGRGWSALPRQHVPYRSSPCGATAAEAKRSVFLFIMSTFPCLCEGYWAELKGAERLTLASPLRQMDFVLVYRTNPAG